MKKAIILFSGGQDSTTCLYWAKKNFNEIYAVGFDYNQSHKIELEKATEIAFELNIPYKIFNIKGLLAKSSLTEHTNHNEKSYIDKTLPASFTSGRNILFLTIAASYGAELGITDIITGVCQTDYSGYPDCRKSVTDTLQVAFTIGMGCGDYRIHTPLMYLTKAETWKMAKELDCLDVIINKTMTDYNGNSTKNEWGFGDINNPASSLRAKGYYEAKEKGWL